eukprot:2834328-Rhodomonas_salina.2
MHSWATAPVGADPWHPHANHHRGNNPGNQTKKLRTRSDLALLVGRHQGMEGEEACKRRRDLADPASSGERYVRDAVTALRSPECSSGPCMLLCVLCLSWVGVLLTKTARCCHAAYLPLHKKRATAWLRPQPSALHRPPFESVYCVF